MDESSEVEDNIIVIMKLTDRRAQCFGLKEFNLHLQNDVRQIYNIYIYIKKSTVRLASVELAQARPNY